MSRDQRPGKLKLVGSGTTVPARRRGDHAPAKRASASSAPSPRSAGAADKAEAAPRKSGRLLLSFFFLIAAGAAGTGVALIGNLPR